MTISKSVYVKYCTIGFGAGTLICIIYAIVAFLHLENWVSEVLYAVSIALAWPCGFIVPLFTKLSGSYIGTLVGLIISCGIGGALYTLIIVTIIHIFISMRK